MELDEFINKHNLTKEQGAVLSQLLEFNEEVLNTINVSILQKKYISNFSLVHLSQITCDIDCQERLLNLSDEKFKLMNKLLAYLPEPENNYRTTLNSLEQGLCNKEFDQLIDNFIDNYNATLSIDFIHIILQEKNYYNINSISDLENYKIKRTEINNDLIFNSKTSDMSIYLQELDLLDRAKFGYINKFFGLTLDQGKLLCQKYAFDIEHSKEIVCSENIHNLLLDLTRIIQANNLDALNKIASAIQPLNNTQVPFSQLETKIRQGYEKMYLNAFFKPQDGVLLKTEEINGRQISVIEPLDDFMICSHVVGAFSGDRKLDTVSDYKQTWNRKCIQSHVFCTKTISNEYLEPAKDDLVCIGFANFGQNSLVASAPWDMASMQANAQFDTISSLNQQKYMHAMEGSGPRFLTPNNQTNYSRGNGAETNWERCSTDGSKVQPSYVVYINNDGENYEHDERYKQSLIVASQFNIPLVFLDRQKILDREKAKIKEFIEQFVQQPSSDLVYKILNKFITNAMTRGCRHDSNITKQYSENFPLDNGNELTLREVVKIISNTNLEMGLSNQDLLDMLGMNIVAAGASSQDEAYFNMVEDVLSLEPSLTFNIDSYIIRLHGITCKGEVPTLSGASHYKHFYFKEHPQAYEEYLQFLRKKQERQRQCEENKEKARVQVAEVSLQAEATQQNCNGDTEQFFEAGDVVEQPASVDTCMDLWGEW